MTRNVDTNSNLLGFVKIYEITLMWGYVSQSLDCCCMPSPPSCPFTAKEKIKKHFNQSP